MDQFYFESGYIEPSYFVYIAEAKIDLRPYIDEGYIDSNYYEYYGISSALSGSLDLVVGEVKEFESILACTATMSSTVFKIIQFACDAGSLFTPSITVNAILRPDVFIESAATVTAVASVNRSTTMAIDSLANVNAQSDITRGYQSTLTATATQITAAGTIKPYQAQLESSTTLSTTAITVELAQATITAIAAVIADGFLSNKRPRIYTEVGSPTINTTTKKFGLGSALLGDSNYLVIPSSTDFTAWRTVDVWFYLPNVSGSQTSNIITTNDFYLDITRVGPPDGISPVISAPSGKVIFFNTITGKRNQWVHLRLVRGGASPYFHLWIDGVKATVLSSDTVDDSIGSGSTTVNLGYRNSNSRQIYLDELLIRDDQLTDPSVSSFSPPTDRWKPTDQTNIEVLSHFDSDFSDDLGIFQLAASTQTVSAALTATATAVKDLDSAQTSTATVTVSAVKTAVIDIAINSESTLSATVNKNTEALADLNTASTVTLQAAKTTAAVIDAGSLFTPNIVINAILRPDVFMESAATATTTAAKTTDVDVDLNTLAAQTTTAVKTTDTTIDLSAAMQQITSGDRTAGVSADLNTSALITATARRVRDLDSVLASTATVTVDVSSFTEAVIDPLVTTATVIALVTKTTDVAAAASTAATITSSAERSRSTLVTLSSDTTVGITATRIRPADTAMTSAAAQTTTAAKTVDSIAQVTAESSLVAVCNYTTDVAPQFDSIATTISAAVKNTNNEVIIETTAGLSALVGRITVAESFGSNTDNQGLDLTDLTISILPNGISEFGQLLGNPPPFEGYVYRANTISIWLKKQSLSGEALRISNQTDSLIEVDGQSLTVTRTELGTEYSSSWGSAIPNDLEWHHIFLKYVSTDFGGYQLWVDGQDQGFDSFNPTGPNTISRLYFVEIPNGTSNFIMQGTAYAAQIRVGDSTITVSDVYDQGYVDLDTDGRYPDLTGPGIYATLDDPWRTVVNSSFNPIDPLLLEGAPLGPPMPDLQVIARLRVGFIGVFLFAVEMPVAVTLSADGDKFPGFAGSLTSTADITAQAAKTTDITATTSTETAVTVTETRVRTTDLELAAEFTINAQPGDVDEGQADFTVTVTLAADITVKPPVRATASFSTESTMTVSAVSNLDSIALLASLGELTADITVIPPIRAEATLAVTTEVIAAGTTQISMTALLTTASALSVSATKFTGIILDLPAQSTLDTTATKFTGIGATLVEAMAFQLTQVSVINLAENLTLVILPESRLLTIGAETREITVLSETRVNTIYRG